jgi:hypothetical protein
MLTARGSLSATAEWFRQGNHALAAMQGDAEDWQTHAALGLSGRPRAAIEGLSRFDHPRARYYLAVCHWIDGDEETARALLTEQPGAHARNLLALLRKPRIEVLAQLPWTRTGCSDLLSGIARDPKFRVRNISFNPDDLANTPYADVHGYYDPRTPPDFYICQMVEWHLLPPNLQQLPCPIFGHTGDYDLHIQAVYPWLQLLDELVVTDPTEWRDVRRLVAVPVSTFAKSFGVPALPPLPARERTNDLFLSGTVTHPFHPDKVDLLHQVLRVQGSRLKVVNGFRDPNKYYANLADARVCVTYIRHSGAMPTRGLEALAMGCGLVVQRDNVLTLWVGEAEGVLTYELAEGDLGDAVRRILTNWPEYRRRAERGSRLIREEFALSRVASQYLRYLTFLAAKPRGRRPSPPTVVPNQKRCVLQTGWLPCYDFHHSPILRRIGSANRERLLARIEEGAADSRPFLDAIRESVLEHHHRARNREIAVADWLATLRPLFCRGVEAAPRSLVLRFNFLRVLFHYGDANAARDAWGLLEETLARPPDEWTVGALEDVFPWDFFPSFFNYRAYFDLVTRHLTERAEVERSLKTLIRASLCHYAGYFAPALEPPARVLEHFRRAAELDPDFPYYQFHHARALLERDLPGDEPAASAILQRLAEGSILFLEAYELLERRHAARWRDGQGPHAPALERLAPIIRKAREQITLVEGDSAGLARAPYPWRGSSLRSLLASLLDRLAREWGPLRGLAHVRLAHDLRELPPERVVVEAVGDDGAPRLCPDHPDGYRGAGADLALPVYRFLVVGGDGLTPRRAAEEYGEPAERVEVGGHEVWLYDRLDHPRFNRFLRARLAARLRAVLPFRGPSSHPALAAPRANLTPVDAPGTVALAVGDALEVRFAAPLPGGLIDVAAGWRDGGVLECLLDDRPVATLRLSEVPWTGVTYADPGLQARLLPLPAPAHGRAWNRVVIHSRGPGPLRLGHLLAFEAAPPGLYPFAAARPPRRFAAADLPTRAGDASLVEDPDASAGCVRRSSPSFCGCLAFGPYLSLPPGHYRADFALCIEGPRVPGPVASLEVAADMGRRLAARHLGPADFRAPGRYVLHGVAFASAEELDLVEFRVFTGGTRAVSLDYIDLFVLPLGWWGGEVVRW